MAETVIRDGDGDPLLRGFSQLIGQYVELSDKPEADMTPDDKTFVEHMSFIFDKIVEVNNK